MEILHTSVRASDTIAVGRAFVVARQAATVDSEQGSVAQERERFESAHQATISQIELLAKDSDIFAAHLEIAADEMLSDSVFEYIDSGKSAVEACLSACDDIAQMFAAMDDEYLSARADDIRDIFNRIVANLSGGVVNPFEGVKQGDIIVARELLPSDMAMLELDSIRGFVTALGSTTSHTCIIARNHSLAVVVGLGDAVEQIATGDTLIVDSTEGRVVVNPDSETMDSYLVRELNLEALRREQQQVAMQSVEFNGEAVAVTANAASVEEVVAAIEAGADGIGLFRSEFLYLNSTVEPTEQQQYSAYSAAAKACGGRPLTIRTLDIGGDKAVPYLGFEREENPFLGWRAIRISLDMESMFCCQLRAILRASAEGNVRVMFPMVATLDELKRAKSVLERCKAELKAEGVAYNENIKVGVMIETPAAVLIADLLAAECDFFSIGTNDLVQYIMAADRANIKVSHLYNPYSEAVIRAIRMAIQSAQSAGIECSMCGELASDSSAVEMLLEAGLRKFSVNTGSIAKIKYTITKTKTN